MAKPTTVATWATSGAVTVPTSGKKAAGFLPRERGAAQYFNWLLRTSGEWQTFLDGLFDGSTNFTLPANASMQVSGTGKYKHGTRTLSLAWSAGQPYGPSGAPVANSGTTIFRATQATGPHWLFHIPLPAGKRLLEVRAHLVDDNSLPAVSVDVQYQTGNTNITGIGSTASLANGTFQTVTVAAINHTMLAGDAYQVAINSTQTNPTSIDWIEIDYDEP